MLRKCWKRLTTSIPVMIIGYVSTVRSSPAFVRLRGSRILRKSASAIFPDVKMVESKSLKLYLFSFRNHGAFHEDCVNIIMKDLIRLMDPKYIEVTGIFHPAWRYFYLSLCQLWPSRHEIRTNGGTSFDDSGVELSFFM